MSDVKKFNLGDIVVARDTLYRSRGDDDKRTWKRHGSLLGRKPRVVHGIYVGSRTFSDGIRIWDYESLPEFLSHNHFTVFLIVEHDRKNPVFALPEDVFLERL